MQGVYFLSVLFIVSTLLIIYTFKIANQLYKSASITKSKRDFLLTFSILCPLGGFLLTLIHKNKTSLY